MTSVETAVVVPVRSIQIQSNPRAQTESSSLSPMKPTWPRESAQRSHSQTHSFALETTDGEHPVSKNNNSGQLDTTREVSAPSTTSATQVPLVIPYPSGTPLSFIPKQFRSNSVPRSAPSGDPQVMQRSQSGPGSVYMSRMPGSQFLYYNQTPTSSNQAAPVAWSRELVFRSPPAPRQRSAQACNRCRKRKTKCSGGQPCERCVSRQLECEYEDRFTLRGPIRQKSEVLPTPPAVAVVDSSSDSSRSSSRNEHRYEPYPSRSPSRSDLVATADTVRSHDPHAPSQQLPPGTWPLTTNVPVMPMDVNVGYHVIPHAMAQGSQPVFGMAPDVPPEGMEMPGMFDNGGIQVSMLPDAFLPQWEPTTDMPPGPTSVWEWMQLMHADDSNGSSDHSRPGSSCSSRGSFAIDPHGPPIHWPASAADYSFGTEPLQPPSASHSSSSLKDALVEPSTLAERNTSTEFTQVLTKILTESGATETSAPVSPDSELSSGSSCSSPQSANAPSTSASSPVMPHSPSTLDFDDVFNLSGTSAVPYDITPSRSYADISLDSTDDVGTMHSESFNNGVMSPIELKTPRAIPLFRFDPGVDPVYFSGPNCVA